jgi:hypothetical protein
VRKLVLLLLVASSFASVTRVATFRSNSSTDPFASCTLASLTGYTQLTACQNLNAGNYVLMNDVTANHSCFGTLQDNVNLHLNGHTITVGANPVVQTWTDVPKQRNTGANFESLTSGTKGIWAPIASVIRVGNTAGASDYVYGTDFFISQDPAVNTTAHSYMDPRALYWVGGRGPANGATYYVTFTTIEGAFGFGAGSSDVNTTNFSQSVIGGGVGDSSTLQCGTVNLSDNAPAFSAAMLAHGRTDMRMDHVIVNQTDATAFNQLAILTEGQNGIEVTNSTFNFANRWATSRDNNHSAVLRTGSTSTHQASPLSQTIHDNVLNGNVHTGILTLLPGTKIYNNRSKAKGKYTNGFFISAGFDTEVYDNICDHYDPLDPEVGGRCIYLGNQAYSHNNIIRVHGYNNNVEYAATGPVNYCEFGIGPYGIQIEGNGSQSSTNDDATGYAQECGARPLRFTTAGTAGTPSTAYVQNGVFRAFRTSTSVVSGAEAVAASFAQAYFGTSPIGATLKGARLEADLWNVEITTTGTVSNLILQDVTMVKGTLNPEFTAVSHPSANYHTWRFLNGGSITCIDCVALNGASLTDVSSTSSAYTLNIKWTYTVRAMSGGVPLAGAVLTLTDAASNSYASSATGMTGYASVVVPQYVVTGTTPTVTSRNPFSLSLTKTGCTTLNASGISVTAPVNENRTMTCPSVSLTSIEIFPPGAPIAVGDYDVFDATCNFSDGSSSTCTTGASWTVGSGMTTVFDGELLRVNNTACSSGTRQLTAEIGAIQDTVTLTCAAN